MTFKREVEIVNHDGMVQSGLIILILREPGPTSSDVKCEWTIRGYNDVAGIAMGVDALSALISALVMVKAHVDLARRNGVKITWLEDGDCGLSRFTI
jgi:hypothetical protein